MKKLKFHLALAALTFFCACSSPEKAIVPITPDPQIEDTYTIIWNGISNAYRYTDGDWKRDETYDYVFNVTQKRYQQQWKSIKNLHRLHPAYDGRAGERSQTMYFEINYALAGSKLAVKLLSSLGKGDGSSDREFRKQNLDFEVEGVSSFAPYDHIRITQTYKYEEGLLEETVFLYKLKDGKEIPFMKNEEKAYFYVKGKLDQAPTRL